MSGTIGSRFPDQYRKDFRDRHLIPGSVFRLFAPETNPPKIKRFVVLAFDEMAQSAAILFINTERPKNDYLKTLQQPIPAKDNLFLDHDSFIDCSNFYERDLAHLRVVLTKDPGIYLGTLSKDDLMRASATVKRAKTISLALKRKYRLF
jgi:hypothetical protein